MRVKVSFCRLLAALAAVALASGLIGIWGFGTLPASAQAPPTGGEVWAWGNNSFAQLGDGTGTFTSTDIPAPVSGLTDVKDVAAGDRHSLTVKNDGTVWAWGDNNWGQLGDNNVFYSDVPVQVNGLSEVVAVGAGDEFSLAVKNDGTVWAWGDNRNGQLGNGTASFDSNNTPVQVGGLANVVAVEGSFSHALALTNDGTVWGWADNSFGQLGDDNFTTNNTPLQVSALTGVVVDIAAGSDFFSLAVKNDGTVWAWGDNFRGQLGDGSTSDGHHLPAQVVVKQPDNTTAPLTDAKDVAAGKVHSLAVKNDGTVWAWGHNILGQLGDGTFTDRPTAVQVSGLTNVATVAGGDRHSLAVKNDGTVWAWGDNGSGQLGDGDGSFTSHPLAEQVSGITGAAAVAAGSEHSLAKLNTTDTTPPPMATIDNKPASLTNDNTPSFSFTSSEAGSSFECSLSTGADSFEPCTSPKDYEAQADGTYTFKVRVRDAAGNLSEPTSYTFTIDTTAPVYSFTGFFSPVDNRPTVNKAKAGQGIPVKFSLGDNFGLNIFEADYPKSQRYDCVSGDLVDVIEETVTAGESSLSYDEATDQYKYTWKTQKSWAGQCRELVVKLNDGSEHRAKFQLTK